MKTDLPKDRGFRGLLVLGAVISLLIGVGAFLSPSILESVLGLPIGKRTLGVGRLFGGAMIAIGIGYALAVAQTRNRSLLVQLFAVPAILLISTVFGLARDEINTAQGIVFAVYNAAYCLLYFRMYPRITTARPADDQPPSTSRNIEP